MRQACVLSIMQMFASPNFPGREKLGTDSPAMRKCANRHMVRRMAVGWTQSVHEIARGAKRFRRVQGFHSKSNDFFIYDV
jgi:hypothetical protein